ncbi:uncharacterized protein EDB91DRAFT_1045077, partial [Suillus paluster]|uniref:uncharacterized protein n=1 Tax=Suillus paluster TaxID=48578 RepID=UPI001B867003
LMLILFSPWSAPKDLMNTYSSWSDAFEHFMRECPPKFQYIMKNMQILHECQDSRDDHYA